MVQRLGLGSCDALGPALFARRRSVAQPFAFLRILGRPAVMLRGDRRTLKAVGLFGLIVGWIISCVHLSFAKTVAIAGFAALILLLVRMTGDTDGIAS